MATLHARAALLPGGMARDVRVVLSGATIAAVEPAAAPQPGDERHDILLPALCNLHSHAFQRAMAGLAETRGPTHHKPAADNFWSWRDAMYRTALAITPKQLEAIAAQAYMEMLEAGFCRVGEFHYLHHDQAGAPYANPAELCERIAAAATETGIALTLLPAFYAQSGFDNAPPTPAQSRFVHDLDRFADLMQRAATLLAPLPGAVLGLAPHSLRAVAPEQLAALLPLAANGPIHIHAAEQRQEVRDCLAATGARPVAWLLDHLPIDRRWCLIHATHTTATETRRLAASGAVVGLCPITEANLGDGIFPAARYLQAAGRLGIGTDSNILISARDELRLLEYTQRLAHRSRTVIAAPGGSTGETLYRHALAGGAQALGVPSGIAAGHPADLLSLDRSSHPWLPDAQILDHHVFAQGPAIDCVWTRGRKQVQSGRHHRRETITRRFGNVMLELVDRG